MAENFKQNFIECEIYGMPHQGRTQRGEVGVRIQHTPQLKSSLVSHFTAFLIMLICAKF